MKTLVFKFTNKEFTLLARNMHYLLLQDYNRTSRMKLLKEGIFEERIKILLLWELHLRIAKRVIMQQKNYRLILTEVQYMAFFSYFNPKFEQFEPFERLIFRYICDDVHQALV